MSRRVLRHEAAWHVARWLAGAGALGASLAAVLFAVFPGLDPRLEIADAIVPVIEVGPAGPTLSLSEPHPLWVPMVYLIGAGALALWLLFGWIARVLLTSPLSTSGDLPLVPRDQSALTAAHEAAKVRWSNQLSSQQIVVLGQLLLRPQTRIRRIMEVVRYEGRALHVATTVVFDVPDDAEPTLYAPVVMREYGTPDDVMTVSDQTDTKVSLLSRESIAALCSLVVDGFARFALASARQPLDATLVAEVMREESQFIRGLVRGSRSGYAAAVARRGRWEALETILGLANDPLATLFTAHALLADAYPVIVPVPLDAARRLSPPQPIRLRVERLEMPSYRKPVKPGLVLRIRETVAAGRRAIGVHSPVHIHQLANADRTAEYHLTVHAPAGLYVESSLVRRQEPGAEPVAELLESSSRGARPYAHYLAEGATDLTRCVAATTFRESPPGSMGDALVTSGLFATVVIALALADGVFSSFGQVVNGLVPVVLATLGATSIWQGVIQTRTPFGGRAAARLSAIVTLLLTVIAVVLAVRPAILPLRTGDNAWLFDFLRDLPFDYRVHWAIVVAVAVVNFVVVLATWAIAVRVEMRLLNRPPRPRPSRSKV